MRPLALLLLLATPAFATQPSFFVIEDYDPDATYFGDLQKSLPGTERHPELQTQLVDALHQASEFSGVELQYGFDLAPNVEYPLWYMHDPIWPVDQAPTGSGSVIYSRSLLEDVERVIESPSFDRAVVPYLAMWPHARIHLERSTADVSPLSPTQIAAGTEVLCGWWIARQDGATLEDCDEIAWWRAEYSGEDWNPGPMLRVGYKLRDLDYEEVINLLLPPAARWLNLEPVYEEDAFSVG